MKLQQVNNQQSFKANVRYVPTVSKTFIKLAGISKDERIGITILGMDATDSVFYHLKEAIRTRNLKRSLRGGTAFPEFANKKQQLFELGKDTLILKNPKKKSAEIHIKHGENGVEGTTIITKDLNHQHDREFDDLANALNALV